MCEKMKRYNTKAEYPKDKTIIELFEEQVARSPDNIAVVSMEHEVWNTVSLTYRELNRKANQLARVLRARGVTHNTIVAIMVERSVEMVVGILGILKAGGAYMPIDPHYPVNRINYILRDSGTKLVLTQGPFLHNKVDGIADIVNLEEPKLYSGPCANLEPLKDASDIAYIIYTSGSTGRPKGVVVEHRSAVNILTALSDAYPLSPTGGYLLKTSFLFDVSVSELFGWFWGGSRLIILEKEGEKDPQTIIDTIEAAGVTHINFVPAMFNAFTRHLDPRNIGKIAGLKYIFLAGEALVPELVSRFRRLNTPIQLENLYGPTEGTVYASRYPLSEWKGTGSIPIGKPMPNVELFIQDTDGQPVASGETGELCIAGAGTARGYLNNPGLTAEKFLDLAAKIREDTRNSSFIIHHSSFRSLYRTGDLARWLPDGNIEFLGRMDFQVKIRGFRVELGEIENRLLKHESIREAVVTARIDENNDRYLCAYVVPSGTHGGEASVLRKYLSQTLPDYMVPSFFITLDQLPLTGSGKVDRKSLPGPEVAKRADYVAPRDRTEEILVELWSEALGLEKDRIGIHDNFFELGGHSLKGTSLVSGIHKTFNVRLRLSELFKMPVFRQLSAYIKEAAEDRYLPLERMEEKEYYTLSSAQKRLYVLQQMDPGSESYNISEITELEGELEGKRLEATFKKLIDRHESLRTSFHMVEEEPVQKIHKKVNFKIEYIEAFNTLPASLFPLVSQFIRSFDLSHAPLFRVGIIKTGQNRHILMVDMNHIISDGISLALFIEDFVMLYEGESLPELQMQYRDYSQWQNNQLASGELDEQENYWLQEFKGELPSLNMPLDYPRPAVQSFEGDAVTFEAGTELTKQLKRVASETSTTLYMVLMAAYVLLLFKYTEKETIVVGSPVAGRLHADLDNTIGMFVNTIALKIHLDYQKSFKQILAIVKEKSMEAFKNQDYPFDILVDKLDYRRDAGRNPLFDTLFVFQNIEISKIKIKNLKTRPYPYKSKTSPFDFWVEGVERKGDIAFSMGYCTKLFKKETIERLGRHFINILTRVIDKLDVPVLEIELVSEHEKDQLLNRINTARGGEEYDFI